jgi:photosystem II stability/assembly factor-like uncharacterized protein
MSRARRFLIAVAVIAVVVLGVWLVKEWIAWAPMSAHVVREDATTPAQYGSAGEYLGVSPKTGDLAHPYIAGKVVVVWAAQPEGALSVPMSSPGRIDLRWDADKPVAQLHPQRADEIGTIVWLDCRAVPEGRFSNGTAAYAAVCEVTVIDKAANTIVGKKTFEVAPPAAIHVTHDQTSAPDAGVAFAPTKEVAAYIEGLPRKALTGKPAASEEHWRELSVGRNGNEVFRGLAFADAFHGWAVEPGGTILATKDGGVTWSRQRSGTDHNLVGVTFPDTAHGWAVGGGSNDVANADTTIVHTSDGGVVWSEQDAGDHGVLFGVSSADATHAWAVGDRGAILSTKDAGSHWVAEKSNVVTTLNGVASTDALHAWVVGDAGVILHTSDGGATWSAQKSGTTNNLMAVAFTDASHGWAVGSGVPGTNAKDSIMLRTTDGGTTWSAQDTGTDEVFYSVSFADSMHGCAVGGRTILSTSDGGSAWNAQMTINADADLRSVAFPNSSSCWAVGTGGTIFTTMAIAAK